MWGLNDVLTHSIAYGMGEEEEKAKAEEEKKASSNWHTGTPTEEGEYLVEDVVVRVDDVIWKVDSLLNRKKNTDYTGQLLDQAIDVVLEEIKRCVNEEMPKYNHIFTKEKKDEEKE